jgi:hypothetical protein
VKLIRPDYNPAAIQHITKENCHGIVNFAIGGWTGLPNAIRVTFSNRERDYAEESRQAINQANAVSQDGVARWQVLAMPAVTNGVLAQRIADRELLARSLPSIKMRVIGDRSLIGLMPGDPVKVTMSNPDIAGLMFRVVAVDHGTLDDGKLGIDLVSDVFQARKNYGSVVPFPRPRKTIDGDLGW